MKIMEKRISIAETRDDRPHRNMSNKRYCNESVHRSKHINNDVISRIKIETPTFEVPMAVTFNDWLVNINYYFDSHNMSEEHNI